MDEKQGRPKGIAGALLEEQRISFKEDDLMAEKAIELPWKRTRGEPPTKLISTPPPASPLAPPELSIAVSLPTPQRQSYNKPLPIGITLPQTSSISSVGAAELTFSPTSYPPTSPLLPASPDITGQDTIKTQQGLDIQGEITPVLNGDGAGWTRHTRVYGGGVCLACAESGGDHDGGFYGATVSPEEMR